METLLEFTTTDLIDNSNRGQNEFSPKTIRYLGFSFRSKIAWFNTGKYVQKVMFPDFKVISKLRGQDLDKVQLALTGDVKVSCTCPDFLYGGFKYIGTELDYSTNKETRPPVMRNPQEKGSVCKHLTYLLGNIGHFAQQIANDIEASRLNNYRSMRRIESKDPDLQQAAIIILGEQVIDNSILDNESTTVQVVNLAISQLSPLTQKVGDPETEKDIPTVQKVGAQNMENPLSQTIGAMINLVKNGADPEDVLSASGDSQYNEAIALPEAVLTDLAKQSTSLDDFITAIKRQAKSIKLDYIDLAQLQRLFYAHRLKRVNK